MASSSAITTRTATEVAPCFLGGLLGFDDETVEQLVLRPLEVGDGGRHRGTASRHRARLALRLRGLAGRARSPGDERADAGVVGGVDEDGQLLLDHGHLLAGASK